MHNRTDHNHQVHLFSLSLKLCFTVYIYLLILCRFMATQRQVGTDDCGIFALAFAYALASGHQPGSLHFHQDKMRGHLRRCLELGRLDMFPVLKERRNRPKLTRQQALRVFCTCRMPQHTPTAAMIQCTKCREWYHLNTCVTPPKSALVKGTMWQCHACY